MQCSVQKLTHIPLTLVDLCSASYKSSKTNSPPVDRVFGDAVSCVRPRDVPQRERWGCGQVMGCYTPHRETVREKAGEGERVRCDLGARAGEVQAKSKRTWEHPSCKPTLPPLLPHPPLLFSLTSGGRLVCAWIVFTRLSELFKPSTEQRLKHCLMKEYWHCPFPIQR